MRFNLNTMSDKAALEIRATREGSEAKQQDWIRINTVSEFFEVYASLNGADKAKLIDEFKTMLDLGVETLNMITSLGGEIRDFEFGAFEWVND